MSKKKFKIKDFFGQEVVVYPKMAQYFVLDFMGTPMTTPCIELYVEEDREEQSYATLTTSFGEFIGMKNAAYIDTNNCPFAAQLLEYGIAKDTGFTKQSGFCTYPLWIFDQDFLQEIGGGEYQQYSKRYDEYMAAVAEGF